MSTHCELWFRNIFKPQVSVFFRETSKCYLLARDFAWHLWGTSVWSSKVKILIGYKAILVLGDRPRAFITWDPMAILINECADVGSKSGEWKLRWLQLHAFLGLFIMHKKSRCVEVGATSQKICLRLKVGGQLLANVSDENGMASTKQLTFIIERIFSKVQGFYWFWLSVRFKLQSLRLIHLKIFVLQ